MPIKVRCGECGTALAVSEKAAGKNVACKSCGAKIRVPVPGAEGSGNAAGPARAAAGAKRPARRKSDDELQNLPAAPDDLFGGLDLGRAEDSKRRVCPSCASPVHLDDIECPKCGVNIATGTLSEKQRLIKSRKGPPPEEFYGAVWSNGWKFLKGHKGFAVSTAIVWSITLSMSVTCLYAYNWYIDSRTEELLASAKADTNISIVGNELIITVPKDGKARYDNKLYTSPTGTTIRLPAPHLSAMRDPPALFWMGMTVVFQLGFGGWAWMLAVKIAELTMSGGKKIKRFQVDFFGNLTMGFRFYFWPTVLMIPFAWIGPLVTYLAGPVPGAFATLIVVTIPLLLFLPAAVIHMTQRYSYRAWLINWMCLDFAKTAAASLYIAVMMFFLVLLIPTAVAVTVFLTRATLIPKVWGLRDQTLVWLNQNILDMGEGSFRFLFYELPLTFSAMFLFFGVICGLMAFPAVL
jgi:hypothetical protein